MGATFQVEHLSVMQAGRPGEPAVTILSDVSVTVEPAGALTLVGPSGSDKSTLLRCAASATPALTSMCYCVGVVGAPVPVRAQGRRCEAAATPSL
jgi:predicted ABC-type transport system involved in lysophospholipase L1 biosynthesis ATPase subunit